MGVLALARTANKMSKSQSSKDGRMSIVDHLIELRRRLFISLVVIIIGAAVVGIPFYVPVQHFITHPYCSLPKTRIGDIGNGCSLIFTSPADGLLVRLKIAMIGGVLVSSPIWLFQIWRFLAPGLYKKEKRYALSFVGTSVLLFATGATFAYLVLSRSLEALVKLSGPDVKALFDISKYLSFVTTLLVVFGAAFELPLLVVMLNVAGIVHSRNMRKHRRFVIFAIFAFAAIATPTQDFFTMLALAVPMCLLYEGAVLFARLNDRRRDRLGDHFGDVDDDDVSPLDTTLTAVGGPQPIEAASSINGITPLESVSAVPSATAIATVSPVEAPTAVPPRTPLYGDDIT